MSDSELALAIVVGVGLSCGFLGCVLAIYRTYKTPVLKQSRSDTDLSSILPDSNA